MAFLRSAGRLAAALAGCAVLTALLMQWAPGYASPEELLDHHRGTEGQARVRSKQRGGPGSIELGVGILEGYLRLDFGRSLHFGRPVIELIADRAAVSFRSLALGLSLAWLAALAGSYLPRQSVAGRVSSAAAVLVQSLPAAALALFAVMFGWSGWWGVGAVLGAVLYPRTLLQARAISARAANSIPVLLARAQGFHPFAIWRKRVFRQAKGELSALGGVSVSWALSALIPLEAVGDQAGLGQLAWQAALARDLPLLMALTMFLCVATVAASSFRAYRTTVIS